MNGFVWSDRAEWIGEVAGSLALTLWGQGGCLLLLALLVRLVLREPVSRIWLARGTLVGLSLLPVLWCVPAWPRWEWNRLRVEQKQPVTTMLGSADNRPAAIPAAVMTIPQPVRSGSVPKAMFEPGIEGTRVDARLPGTAPANRSAPAVLPAQGNTFTTAVSGRATEPHLASATRQQVSWGTVLGLGWLGGVGVISLWLATGGICVRWRVWRSPSATETLQRILRQVAGTGKVPRLRVARFWRVPGAVGAWRPVIVLPSSAEMSISTEEPVISVDAVQSALAHELAHIRAGDLRWLAVERVVWPVYFSQPLFWLYRRCLREDQELVADAVAGGSDRVAYAAALLEWIKAASLLPRTRRPALFAHGLSMSESPRSLSRRMEMLLDPRKVIRLRVPRRVIWTMLLLMIGAACGIAAVDPRSSDAVRQMRRWVSQQLAPRPLYPVAGRADTVEVAARPYDKPIAKQNSVPSLAAPKLAKVAFEEVAAPVQAPRRGPIPAMPPLSAPEPWSSIPSPTVQAEPPQQIRLEIVYGRIDENAVQSAGEVVRDLLPGMADRIVQVPSPPGLIPDPDIKELDHIQTRMKETWLPTSEAQLRLRLAGESQLVKVLNVPTLITIDGDEASFLSGGEIPLVEVRERIDGQDRPVNLRTESTGVHVQVKPVIANKQELRELARSRNEKALGKGLVPYLGLKLRFTLSELQRSGEGMPPVIHRQVITVDTVAWKPETSLVLVEQQVQVPQNDLDPFAETVPPATPVQAPKDIQPGQRRERNFLIVTPVIYDDSTLARGKMEPESGSTPVSKTPGQATPHADPFTDGPASSVPTPAPPPALQTPGDVQFFGPAPVALSDRRPDAALTDTALPNADKPNTITPNADTPWAPAAHVTIQLYQFSVARNEPRTEGVPKSRPEDRFDQFRKQLTRRIVKPDEGQPTFVALRMHMREWAGLVEFMTRSEAAPQDNRTPIPFVVSLTKKQTFQFLADPNVRRLAGSAEGVPLSMGVFAFAFETSAQAVLGTRSDGERGVTHFQLDARAAGYDQLEAELKHTDLDPLRIARFQLKQAETPRFRLSLAPREVVVFVEQVPVLSDAEGWTPATCYDFQRLIAVVSCEESERDSSLSAPAGSSMPYYQGDQLVLNPLSGSTVEPVSPPESKSSVLQGVGVGSKAGVVGEITLDAAPVGSSTAGRLTESESVHKGRRLRELDLQAAQVKREAFRRELERIQKLVSKGVVTAREKLAADEAFRLAEIEVERCQILLDAPPDVETGAGPSLDLLLKLQNEALTEIERLRGELGQAEPLVGEGKQTAEQLEKLQENLRVAQRQLASATDRLDRLGVIPAEPLKTRLEQARITPESSSAPLEIP